LGEKTTDTALKAINAAAALLLIAKYPIISVNGNVAALCAKDLCNLNQIIDNSALEINLFYATQKRKRSIAKELKKYSPKKILGLNKKKLVEIPELKSNRRNVDPAGIYKADVVFVPLEDGDRTIALKKMKKKVITVDLNPLSRTALSADITIVDNIIRVIPLLIKKIEYYKKHFLPKDLYGVVDSFDNNYVLTNALDIIRSEKNLNSRLS
jgi:4-phosphopantoate--beta-alanine ligase